MAWTINPIKRESKIKKEEYDRLREGIIDIAGLGRTDENVKANADEISTIKTTLPVAINWSSSITYSQDTIVIYEGIMYISLQNANLDKQPDSEAAWWAVHTGRHYISTALPGPADGQDGDIWLVYEV